MPSNSYPLFAREGWALVIFLLVMVYIGYVFLGMTSASAIVLITILIFYLIRDPVRNIPSLPLGIVSPVHGRIISVEKVEDHWISRQAVCIKIKMSWLDIYSLRSPIEGKIMQMWSNKDTDAYANIFAFWIKTDEGDDIITEIRFHPIPFFGIRFYAHSGERLGQGQRCGYIYFGGEVNVYIPENSSKEIKPGGTIHAGSGVIAKLIHNEGASVIGQSEEQSPSPV